MNAQTREKEMGSGQILDNKHRIVTSTHMGETGLNLFKVTLTGT